MTKSKGIECIFIILHTSRLSSSSFLLASRNAFVQPASSFKIVILIIYQSNLLYSSSCSSSSLSKLHFVKLKPEKVGQTARPSKLVSMAGISHKGWRTSLAGVRPELTVSITASESRSSSHVSSLAQVNYSLSTQTQPTRT